MRDYIALFNTPPATSTGRKYTLKTTIPRLTVWQFFRATAADYEQAHSIMKEASEGVGIDIGDGLHLDLIENEFVLTHFSKASLMKFQTAARHCTDTTVPNVKMPVDAQAVSALVDGLLEALQETFVSSSEYIAEEITQPAERERLQRLHKLVQDTMSALKKI